MARKQKSARQTRAMHDIESGLKQLALGLRLLARDMTNIVAVPPKGAGKRRRVSRALRMQGRYMGLIRTLPVRKKAQVMALRASKGVERAIAMAREMRAS